MTEASAICALYDICSAGDVPDQVVSLGATHAPETRRGFQARVAGLAARLRAEGGDVWAISCDDTYLFALALFGVLQAGATPLLLPHAQPDLVARMREQASGLVSDAHIAAEGLRVIHPGEAGDSGSDGWAAVRLTSEREIILWTSGSTGAPSLIRKPLRCLNDEVQTLERLFGASGADAVIAGSVGHQHIYGLLFRVLWPLMSGRPIWRPLVRYPEDLTLTPGAPIFISSPAFLKRAVPAIEDGDRSITCHRVFSSGGPLPTDISGGLAAMATAGAFEIYGSTETGGVAWRQVQSADAVDAWQPMPGVAVRDDTGLLEVKSPHIAEPDWFTTSDRVTIAADGRFTLGGRVDRIAKIEEKRVSLTEIEQRLSAHELVSEGRVLVVPGRGRVGLGAVIVPNEAGWRRIEAEGRQAVKGLLRAMLADAIEGVALPRWWRFVKSLPRNSEGKTSESALAALFQPLPGTRPEVRAVSRSGDSVALTLHIGADIYYFRGHFPETPVLPGVVQLDWAMSFAEEQFGLSKADFLRIEALKFQKIIEPDREVILTLEYAPAKGAVSFSYDSGEDRHGSGRLIFGGQP